MPVDRKARPQAEHPAQRSTARSRRRKEGPHFQGTISRHHAAYHPILALPEASPVTFTVLGTHSTAELTGADGYEIHVALTSVEDMEPFILDLACAEEQTAHGYNCEKVLRELKYAVNQVKKQQNL